MYLVSDCVVSQFVCQSVMCVVCVQCSLHMLFLWGSVLYVSVGVFLLSVVCFCECVCVSL